MTVNITNRLDVPVKILPLPIDVMADGSYFLAKIGLSMSLEAVLQFQYPFVLVNCSEGYVPQPDGKHPPMMLYVNDKRVGGCEITPFTTSDGRECKAYISGDSGMGFFSLEILVFHETGYSTMKGELKISQRSPYHEVPHQLRMAGFERLWVKKR